MRQTRLLILLVLVLSCKNQTSKPTLRDTVIQNYLSMVDSSGMYDTTDLSYKTLKAYVQNDTASLARINKFIKNKKYYRPNWELWTSDIPLPQLKKTKTDEAYRFIYSLQGSATYEAITILKRDTTFELNYLFYIHNSDSSKFDKIKSFDKNISGEQWQTLKEKINKGSFWELKSDIDSRGWDGSDLTVIGYYKSDDFEKNNFVHRFMGGTLNDAFYFVYYNLLNKDERQFGK